MSRAIREAAEAAVKSCPMCHGTGTWHPHCYKCDDSTLDHADCPEPRSCTWCAALRAALDEPMPERPTVDSVKATLLRPEAVQRLYDAIARSDETYVLEALRKAMPDYADEQARTIVGAIEAHAYQDREDEREACARVAETTNCAGLSTTWGAAQSSVAAAIRARGTCPAERKPTQHEAEAG